MLTHLMSPINRIGIDSPVKLTHNGAKILSISSLNYQDSARYNEVAMAIAGDCGHQAHADINARENIRQDRGKEAERDVVENRLSHSFRLRRLSAAVTSPRLWARVVYYRIECSSD